MATILCTECGSRAQLHPEDIKFGWEQRTIQGVARKPGLVCDQCGVELREGTLATEITRWRHEDAPPEWELEYMIPANPDDHRKPQRTNHILISILILGPILIGESFKGDRYWQKTRAVNTVRSSTKKRTPKSRSRSALNFHLIFPLRGYPLHGNGLRANR